VGDNESAVEVVSKILKGELTEAFNILKPIDKFGEKYLEAMKNKLEFLTQEGGKKKLRPEIIADLIKDISSLKIMGHSSDIAEAKSDLAEIEQTLQDLTNNVLRPAISLITTGIKKVKDFIGNFSISNIVITIGDSISSAISGLFTKIRGMLPKWLGGTGNDTPPPEPPPKPKPCPNPDELPK
ncbi:hypothetical protein ER70_09480, partial (plasmid) [Borreliella bissettiae]